MNRLQGWVRYAAEYAQRASSSSAQQQQQVEEEEEDFIYGRIAVHSDDEDAGPQNKPPRPKRRISAPDKLTTAPDDAAPQQQQQQQQPQQQPQHLPATQLTHLHSHSDGELLHLDSTCLHQVMQRQLDAGPSLIKFDSGDGAGWADWGELGAAAAAAGSQQQQQAHSDPQQQHEQQRQQQGTAVGPSSGSSSAPYRSAAGVGSGSSRHAAGMHEGRDSGCKADHEVDEPETAAAAGPSRSSSGMSAAGNADGDNFEGEVPDHEHSMKRQELLIYAIPLTRGKVIFLPVCPWRAEPEQPKGWKKAVAGQVGRVQGEASDIWQRMAAAEQGSVVHRVYKLGKRVLDSISPEERLMRGVPKNISKVIINHPSQVSPESIMDQMQTMTKSYGLKAVGRAAAATVMLPLAVGVDLIILPGPQVLTYYTMWELYRNTNGALGTTRMTKFITQGGSSENIRVNYVAEPRLDKYYDLAHDCPEGVLSEDDIEGLTADLREPDLAEALLSLRNKALREAGRRTSRGGDEYTALPPTDPAVATGMGGGSRG